MAQRAVYTYAWDLADHGVSTVVEDLRGRNINTISLAGSYHAGKFLRPAGRSGKIYFPEDGTVYFSARPDRYGKIKPVANSLISQSDPFAQLCAENTIAVQAWMVLLHNTRLGTDHPDATVVNAFGDHYVYSLCPSNPHVREYAVSLCADITDLYPIDGISLETPGFLPFEHGFHHEFSLVNMNSWLGNLLGLCFCGFCETRSAADGIDVAGLRNRIRAAVETWLSGDVDYPRDMADAFWAADIVCDPDLGAFLRRRCRTVETLVAEIRDAVRKDAAIGVIPSVARPTGGAWYEGSDIARLAQCADTLDICFYEPTVERIRADLADVSRRSGGTGRLRAILRPGPPDLQSREAVVGAVGALLENGIRDIAFYNYGHLKRCGLDWMSAALSEDA